VAVENLGEFTAVFAGAWEQQREDEAKAEAGMQRDLMHVVGAATPE